MLFEQRKNDELCKKKNEDIKMAKEAVVRQKFELLTDKKILMNRLKQKVEFGMEAAERNLQLRRQK